MANKRSRNKSTRANPSSAQGPLSSAQEVPDTGVSAACAKPVALQADPSPLSAQTAATSMERTWASLFKPAAYVASPSVANTTAAPAPAQGLCTEYLLKEVLKNCHQWDEQQFKRGCQNILRSLAGKVAHLGSKGITHGPLTGENILVIGTKAENLEVEICDTPHKYNPAMRSYREQFRTLASKMVETWKANCPLASEHFFEMLDYCIPWFYFKQLEWHPLLLSSHEVAVVIFRLYTHLEVEKKGWKNNYKKLITRENVDFGKIISGTGRGAPAFFKVHSYPSDQKKKALQLTEKEKENSYSPVEYEPNALGALEFFRHAFSHVNDHMWDYFVEKNAKPEIELLQKPEEIPADALLTPEEIENTLAQAFPEVPLELFNYMLHKHIDINAAIT